MLAKTFFDIIRRINNKIVIYIYIYEEIASVFIKTYRHIRIKRHRNLVTTDTIKLFFENLLPRWKRVWEKKI